MGRKIWFSSITAIAGAALLACLASSGSAQASAQGRAGVSTSKPPSSCQEVAYPSSRYFINSDGTRVAHATSTTTTATIFRLPGMTVPVYATPRSFNPATATADLLKQIGIAPRPSGGASLHAWLGRYEKRKGLRSITPPWMCVTNLRAQGPTNPSDNWSGLETYTSDPTTQGGYAFVLGESDLPTLESSTCPQPASYSVWSGIGGDGASNPLMQAGASANSDGTYSLFYELVASPSTGLPTFNEIDTGVLADEGDDLSYDTLYTPPTSTEPGSVEFDYYDYTLDEEVTVGPFTEVEASADVYYYVSDYYTGASAEIISEAPTLNNEIESLEEPTTGSESFLDDVEGIDYLNGNQNYEFMSQDPNLNFITMDGSKTGNTISEVTNFTPWTSGSSALGDTWSTKWLGCD